jgi:predicted nucleic acid-binding protein
LLQGGDLYAPVLLAYELTSIARRKCAAYPDRLDAFAEALQTGLALPIHWIEVEHRAVLQLALATDLTTYDASYLYVSQALGAQLATFDERLAQAARLRQG